MAVESWIQITDKLEKFVAKYGRLPTETDPDYLEMLRMSKYRIKDVPDVTPAKCGNCGSSKNDGRKYIDIGLHIDWYGALFLCGHCLLDIARTMGLFEELEQKLADVTEALAFSKELQDRGEELHNTVVKTFKEFEEFYASLHSPGVDSNSGNGTGVEPYQSPVGPPATDVNEQNVNGPKPRATKSASSSGSKNVRSLADLLNDGGSGN